MMTESYVIAIDFGTTYSGYAYSLTPRGKDIDPYLKYWGADIGKETPKAPTCILFDEHGEFMNFGYEAKMAYVEMHGEDLRKHFFFENFKMSLYGKKNNRDVMINAANGKSMKALKVFTEALRYLKEDALKTISENASGRKFIASDFTWVLTVPAIWDSSAKQFMREAATQAGIVSKGKEDKLVIALEPEAASVWCKKLPAKGFIAQDQEGEKLDQSPGTRYIVVDCGGGTIDITVHEVLDGGSLKELHKASGNDLGGQNVDKKYKEFLREIFCNGFWDEYERENPNEVQSMMYDFTDFKKKNKDIQIPCKYNLGKRENIQQFFENVQGASWNDGYIKVSKEKLRSFFNESLNGVTESLREILNKDLQIEYILLVGGYAESEVLREHIKSQFGRQSKVLCPFRPQQAIVKGALMFGGNPEVVASRKSAFTYGTDVYPEFDESKHNPEKKYTSSTGERCNDVFMKLVEIDEDVGWNEPREHILMPTVVDQKSMRFRFFRTEKKDPLYVDERGIEEFGSFNVKMPDIERGLNRKVKLKIRFGFTEMTATAIDMDSKSTASIQLDFLSK